MGKKIGHRKEESKNQKQREMGIHGILACIQVLSCGVLSFLFMFMFMFMFIYIHIYVVHIHIHNKYKKYKKVDYLTFPSV